VTSQSGSLSEGGGPATNSPVLREITEKGRPVAAANDYLLKADLNFARLSKRIPIFPETNQPLVELTVSGKGDKLRSEARVVFPEPIPWQLEPWQIPTNTIRDPQGSLISFTAVQGIAPWLNRRPFLRELGLVPAPNQFFAWHDTHAPFQIQAAAPVPNAAYALAKFAVQPGPMLNLQLKQTGAGELQFSTNRNEIAWIGLPPVFRPFLRSVSDSGRDFLAGGIFPLEEVNTNPPPSALLEQITSRTNLVYYHWEITQERLAQLRFLGRHLPMFLDLPNMERGSSVFEWLDALEPKLGNTVTEISVASPRELRSLRSSHAGLDGLELMALAYWFHSTNFPRVTFQVSFLPPVQPRKPAAKP
jgi:hypothetical protein